MFRAYGSFGVDQKGRVQGAICFNMDLGDAWEWADYPAYPEPYSALAHRIGVNYIVVCGGALKPGANFRR